MPRRRPTQERSQRKFDALLQASRELLSDVGFESFTCEEVASRAELPIGTLYQFFANKEALAEALAERYRAELKAAHEKAFDLSMVKLPLPELVDLMMAVIVINAWNRASVTFRVEPGSYRRPA